MTTNDGIIGIKFKWECPSCGSIIESREPFNTKKIRKMVIAEDPKCPCGNKGELKMLDFEKIEFEFVN